MDIFLKLFAVTWLISTLLLTFFIRIRLVREIVAISQLLTNSLTLAKILLALIFYPGVIVHELSHLFSAMFLGVKTGDISFTPQENQDGYKLGWVKIAKTDPIRTALIGAAPLLVAWLCIYVILSVQFSFLYSLEDFSINLAKDAILSLKGIVSLYLIFNLSNAMMLSKSDERGFLPAGILVGFFIILLSFLKIPNIGTSMLSNKLWNFVYTFAVMSTIVTGINTVIVVILSYMRILISSALGKQISFTRRA